MDKTNHPMQHNMNEQLIQKAMDYVDEGILITNKENNIIYTNKKLEEITGFLSKELEGKTPEVFQLGVYDEVAYKDIVEELNQDGVWQGEVWNRSKLGKIYLQALKVIAVKDDKNQFNSFIYIYTDLLYSDLKELKEFPSSSYIDLLTKLPNRVFLENLFDLTVQFLKDPKETFAIIYMELDSFHMINEEYGFHFGDTVIKTLAKKLNDQFPSYGTLTRWGGVEFVILLEKVTSKLDVSDFVENIIAITSKPIIVSGIEVDIKLNIGISMYLNDGTSLTELLSKANKAMKAANNDRLAYQFYDQKRMGLTNRSFIMKLELQKAVEKGEFEIYYQPLVSLETNELTGLEALIRWNHPTDGLVSPGKFIPLAEQTGLIQDIGKWVLENVCNHLRKWNDLGHNINVSINLSMNQFKDPYLVQSIENILKDTKISPDSISLELTESAVIHDIDEAIVKLNELKKLGVNIAIDDFGTGYSSLGYIIDFPINRIKIDRSFINLIDKNKKVEAIVSAIITMGEKMGIEVVAEGIETIEQLQLMKKVKCMIGQGFLFDKPLEKSLFESKWLA